ncbi:MAG: ABC transporter permease subunit [Coxiellaceae bacterium]|nr:ABC transporter permease subunit [Coxiellaceae bacterium]
MYTPPKNTYTKLEVGSWRVPNYWDVMAFVLVMALIFLMGWGVRSMSGHFVLGQSIPISLSPWKLPYYAFRSVLRMLIALCCSLLFTFIFGTWAAKSRQAERIIIPLIDVLQSVPVLGFLSITVVGFIVLFHGSMLGPECAAIFAILVAQVWNMTLSFYQSLRTVPHDLLEASAMFQLSGWQRYWRVEVPFAMPGLLWNTMMSMSGSWVFLVAAEAFPVENQHVTLPGIGSYIAMAIHHADKAAIAYVIIAMAIVIAIYDQLLFRPLIAWAEKFKAGDTSSEIEPESWLLNLFQRTRALRVVGEWFARLGDVFVNMPILRRQRYRREWQPSNKLRRTTVIVWNSLLVVVVLVCAVYLVRYVYKVVPVQETLHVFGLGFITAVRVTVLIIISSLVWVPIGVWIGMRPHLTQKVQPVLQFLAAFPVNLLFPIAVMIILRYQLNVNVWTSPLMILGTQWYILFNVIAGTAAIPKNMHNAVGTLYVRGWLWWKRFALPAIFPFYVTGVITAAGGAWNISIISEAVSWGHVHLYATGLGSYITKVYDAGDFQRLALGIAVMSTYVLVINRVLWRPLYNLADRRFRIT